MYVYPLYVRVLYVLHVAGIIGLVVVPIVLNQTHVWSRNETNGYGALAIMVYMVIAAPFYLKYGDTDVWEKE